MKPKKFIDKSTEYQDLIYDFYSIKCKYCGHTLTFPPTVKKKLCSHCHRYNFINKKEEFMYRFKEAKNKKEREA